MVIPFFLLRESMSVSVCGAFVCLCYLHNIQYQPYRFNNNLHKNVCGVYEVMIILIILNLELCYKTLIEISHSDACMYDTHSGKLKKY